MMEQTSLWKDCFFHAQDGLRLHYRDYGPLHTSRHKTCPLICLPGLTRTVRDFHDLAVFFAGHAEKPRRVISLDYRGRGLSDHDHWQNYTVINEAYDVMALLTSLNIGRAWFIGTSRGGLIIMALSALRPSLIRGVVMNDIGPVINHQGILGLKQILLNRKPPATWEEAMYWTRRTFSSQFPAYSDEDWLYHTRTTYADENGKPVSDFDENLLNTFKVLDADTPPPELWPQFEGLRNFPTLVIRGEKSPLLTMQTLEHMHEHHKNMRSYIAEGEGHAPQMRGQTLEKIAEFI
jgi:pimeloyl-ACP methyl ester carboxylesterase